MEYLTRMLAIAASFIVLTAAGLYLLHPPSYQLTSLSIKFPRRQLQPSPNGTSESTIPSLLKQAAPSTALEGQQAFITKANQMVAPRRDSNVSDSLWPSGSVLQSKAPAAAAGFSVLTLATHPGHNLDRMVASSPYDVTILGKGREYEKYRSKLLFLLDELMAREEHEVILFVDAFDIMFIPCGRNLFEEFKAMEVDLVFQADDFDWPDVEDNAKNLLFPAPPKDAHPNFRFLCAGAWMGKVWAVRHFLSAYFLRTGQVDRLLPAFDDQRWWRNIFLGQVFGTSRQKLQEPVIGLDYHGRLFQMFRPWTSYIRVRANGESGKSNDRIYCIDIYKQVPACILHAEGPEEGWKDKFWGTLIERFEGTNESVLFKPGM